jgi:mono/diheme cytochrome c family protein
MESVSGSALPVACLGVLDSWRFKSVVALLVVALAGCEGVLPGFDWQQMNNQPKFQPYEECRWFSDGRAMQSPPQGTVVHAPRDPLEQASAGGAYLDHLPLPVTRELFTTGRFAFETYCAACHGANGSGDSEVARNMDLRRPPSLVDDRVRAFPPGRIFQVATEGYGLMPSYASELSPRERWAAVAYLMALQRAGAVDADKLPPGALKELSP